METKARKGLASYQRLDSRSWLSRRAYNRAVKAGPVEMEEALKAGHKVELESETQSCATAMGSVDVRIIRSDADFMVSHSAWTPPELCDPDEPFPAR